MSAILTFQKALLQLDHGRVEKGEVSLKQAISEAQAEQNRRLELVASVCLGDLLCGMERSGEAGEQLQHALRLASENPDLQGDVCDKELRRAEQLLREIDGNP